MGNLTAAQLSAIQGGQPVRQRWWVRIPLSAAHAAYIDVEFENGLLQSRASGLSRVIDPGKRTHTVWNPHPAEEPKASALRYMFAVDNSDSMFCRGSGRYWNYYGIYAAAPEECFIIHKLYVWDDAAGAWSEITHMAFTGRVVDVDYASGARMDGAVAGNEAVITCEQEGAWSALRYVFKPTDGDHTQVTDGTTGDFYFNVT